VKPILIIQNDAHEGAGLLATLLDRRGHGIERWLGWEMPSLREPADYAALVLLGGAQAAYETDAYPYLADEIDLARRFKEAGRPVLGFCLGAQLLAIALGGDVHPNAKKEIGWGDLTLTAEGAADPLFDGLPATFPAFHFHGDYFDTPPGCDNLAATAMTACQLFRAGPGVYGFQYHAEIDGPLAEVMCRNNADYMAANGFDADTVLAQSSARMPSTEERSGMILGRWIELVEGQA